MHPKEFILVAEDDLDDQQLLQTVFKEKKYLTPLRFVNNGIELIDYLHLILENNGNHPYPNFILLDLNMPKMDGKQALKVIKEHAALKRIPVIVFSTTENKSEIDQCYELGANTYVVKPTSYTKLLTTMEAINRYWLNTATIPVPDMR